MKANSILPIRLSFLFFLLTFSSGLYAFELVCPADVTIDCNEDIYDLSIYGNAQYKDYSGWHDAGYPTVEYDLNHCDQGDIIRTWTVYNPYGETNVSCSQVITVGSGATFTEANINWPQTGLEVFGCNPDLSPSSLPPGYQQPTWSEGPCSMIGYSYSDKVFSISGACKKVVREWELINCCDFNVYTGHGIFTYYQEFDITITDLPDLVCPDDITVSTSDCQGQYVDIPVIELPGGLCSEIVQISNDSPFASGSGANASGIYPIGTTEVSFLANFGCSDLPEVCKINVTVEDISTPTPYCHYGLSIALMGIDADGDGVNEDGMVEIWASDLDAGSFASCSSEEDLIFSFSSDPNDNNKTFTCEDVGRNDVEIWVTDQYGKQSFCNTYVRVQNNAANISDCEDSDEYSSVSGQLQIHYGGSPDEVSMKAVGTSHVGEEFPITVTEVIETIVDSFQNATDSWIYVLEFDTITYETTEIVYPTETTYMTNFGQEYSFEELPHYYDYTIHVEGEDSDLNRINQGDLVELRAYLEGFVEFTAYQKMAADINEDGEVTLEDYNMLKDYLNNVDGIEIDMEWHFFDKGMDMENMDENHECEEFCRVMDLKDDTYKVNLIGYRVGDITDIDVAATDLSAQSLQTVEAPASTFSHEISPNPFINSFSLELDGAEKGEAIFVLKNQSGITVLTRTISIESSKQLVSINVAKPLLSGVYLYEIRTSKGIHTGKILKI